MADIVMVLAPDEHQAAIYNERPQGQSEAWCGARPSRTASTSFGLIDPRADNRRVHDRAERPGHTVRSEYQRGGGVPCLIAIAHGCERQRARRRPSPMPRRSAAAARA